MSNFKDTENWKFRNSYNRCSLCDFSFAGPRSPFNEQLVKSESYWTGDDGYPKCSFCSDHSFEERTIDSNWSIDPDWDNVDYSDIIPKKGPSNSE